MTWTDGPVLGPAIVPLPAMLQTKVLPVPSVWAVWVEVVVVQTVVGPAIAQFGGRQTAAAASDRS